MHQILIRGQQDISGLMYRRNRYYDPMTGQFTQSDPIGIAGGHNTYGFAAGDPISYDDPFGLCKRDEEGNEDPECRKIITLLELTAKVAEVSDLAQAELLYAANVYERFEGDVRFINAPESTSGGSMPYFIGTTTADQTSVVRLNTAVSGIDLALVAYHESQHLSVGRGFEHAGNRKPGDLDPTDRMQAIVYNGLPAWLRSQATETRRYLQGWGAIP